MSRPDWDIGMSPDYGRPEEVEPEPDEDFPEREPRTRPSVCVMCGVWYNRCDLPPKDSEMGLCGGCLEYDDFLGVLEEALFGD